MVNASSLGNPSYLGELRSNWLSPDHHQKLSIELWLLYLLRDSHVSIVKLLVLYCDNQSVLNIVANPVFHERTKHIEIDCHLVREKLQTVIIKLLPVSSKDQLADFLPRLFFHNHSILFYLSWECWIYLTFFSLWETIRERRAERYSSYNNKLHLS